MDDGSAAVGGLNSGFGLRCCCSCSAAAGKLIVAEVEWNTSPGEVVQSAYIIIDDSCV